MSTTSRAEGRTTVTTATIQPIDARTKAPTLTATASPVRLSHVARASPRLVTAAAWAARKTVGKIPGHHAIRRADRYCLIPDTPEAETRGMSGVATPTNNPVKAGRISRGSIRR